MRITLRGFAAATVGLVSAVGLAGCSGNSTKPTVLPSLSTTTAVTATTPAATPTPASSSPGTTTSSAAETPPPSSSEEPSQPSLAATNRQIRQAVQRYYATVNKALQNKDALAEMRSMYGPGCEQCVSDASNFSRVLANHWKVTGGTYQLTGIEARAETATNGAATVKFDVLAGKATDAAGHIVATEAAHLGRSEGLTLVLVAGRWKILGYVSFGSSK